MNYKKALLKFEKLLKQYSFDDCNIVTNYVASIGFRETFPKAWLGKGKKILFEGKQFVGPECEKSVLQNIYGNYMELPPEEKRQPKTRLSYANLDKCYKEYKGKYYCAK